MEYEMRKKQISENQNYQLTEDYDTFRIQTTKKPVIRQTDFQVDQSSPTDRVLTHLQQNKPSYRPQKQPQQSTYELAQRTVSYPSGGSQYQFLIYENKIHLLTDRLQCYMDEVQNLKKTNAILISKLSTIESLDQDLENQKLKNLQLREQVQTYRDRLQDQKDDYQAQINELKQKLQEKDNFIELMREENSKIMKKKDQQIAFLRQALREKTNQMDSYQKQLHSIQIQRLNTSDDFSSRDSLFTKQSAMSQYNIRNSENNNTMNMHQSTISVEEKARQFVKKNQTELKIAMKSISHAQKCLEIGGQQISTIMVDKENEKSMINMSRLSRSKVNKTYCK